MKPVKLILNNIGPFSSENTIDFDSLGDIFLISGKTGSGKTTLFDSMFYALYGALPGTRAGTDKNLMKCQFSPPETDSFVDFTFKLNNCKYRIIRHPPFKKLSAKTGKTVPTEEKAVFYKINRNGEKEILSDKVSEIKKTVENLLGLSEEEFSSIILLPQGKFAEFLHMNSTDRKEVLLKLFPVEKYRQVILSAMEKNKINKARIEAVENQIIAIQNDFNPETAEKEIPVMENNRTELKNNMEKNQTEISECSKKVEKAKTKEIHRNRLKELTEKSENLKSKRDLINNYSYIIKLAPKARNAERAIKQRENQLEEIESKRNDLKKLKAEKAETEILHENSKQETERIPALKNAKENLLKDFNAITKARESYKSQEENQSRIAELEKNTGETREQINLILNESRTTRESISEIEKKSEDFSLLYKIKENLSGYIELLEKTKDCIKSIEAEKSNLNDKKLNKEKLENKLIELEKKLSGKKHEKKQIEQKKEENINSNLAGKLSLILVENEKCPVCGSRNHPEPAKAIKIDISIDNLLDCLVKEIENTENEKIKTAALTEQNRLDITKAEENLKKQGEEFKSCSENVISSFKVLVSHGFQDLKIPDTLKMQEVPACEPGNSLLALEQEILLAENKLEEVENRIKENTHRETTLNQLRSLLSESEKKLDSKKNLLSELEKEIAEKKEANAPLKENLNEAGKIISKYQSPSGTISISFNAITGTEKIIQEKIRESETDINMITENFHNTEKHLLSIDSKIETLTEELEKNIKNLRNLNLKVSEEIGKFVMNYDVVSGEKTNPLINSQAGQIPLSLNSNEEESITGELLDLIKSFAVSEAEEESYSLEISKYEKDLTENAANLANTREQLELLGEIPPLEILENKLLELKAKDSELLSGFREITEKISTLKNNLVSWKNLEEERKKLSDESKVLNSLAMDLNGNNPKNKTFDAWILANYLEEISMYASKRLDKMSSGRYRLLVNTEQKRGNAKTGLDLEIFDSYTGKKRPCTTLSGGETFMTSISLALGLADSIQNKNGNIELDSVFIDEGFGSLDSETLEKAMEILEEIRGQRTVGIISHIAELKEWIPSAIQIEKTEKGSFIL